MIRNYDGSPETDEIISHDVHAILEESRIEGKIKIVKWDAVAKSKRGSSSASSKDESSIMEIEDETMAKLNGFIKGESAQTVATFICLGRPPFR